MEHERKTLDSEEKQGRVTDIEESEFLYQKLGKVKALLVWMLALALTASQHSGRALKIMPGERVARKS